MTDPTASSQATPRDASAGRGRIGLATALVATAGIAVTTAVLFARPVPDPGTPPLFSVLDIAQDNRDLLLHRLAPFTRVDDASTRWLADVDDARIWIAETEQSSTGTGTGTADICLVVERFSNPEIGTTACTPREQILDQGYLWHQSGYAPEGEISLYLVADSFTPELPGDEAVAISERAQLFIAPSPSAQRTPLRGPRTPFPGRAKGSLGPLNRLPPQRLATQ